MGSDLRLSRGRRIAFTLVAMVAAATIAMMALFAVDLYLHRKFERSAGLNIWGYRGPAVGRKQVDEYRVVMVGGSTTYGYGTYPNEAIAAILEHDLAGHAIGPFRRYTVVNLGYNSEGAYAFKFTLNDYVSLRYDLAILYEGYNDITGDVKPNLSVLRHQSPVFRMTGYMPIFPLVVTEKAATIVARTTASMSANSPKTVFRPALVTRAAAQAVLQAAEIGASLERQIDHIAAEPDSHIDHQDVDGCVYPWQRYCESMMVAADFALQHDAQVLVVTQPYGSGAKFRARHTEQQSTMARMLERRFGGNPRVRYLNLGDVVDLLDPQLSFDRMHLTVSGNQRVAAGLAQPVLDMAARRAGERR
jgi:hypothetical protein